MSYYSIFSRMNASMEPFDMKIYPWNLFKVYNFLSQQSLINACFRSEKNLSLFRWTNGYIFVSRLDCSSDYTVGRISVAEKQN